MQSKKQINRKIVCSLIAIFLMLNTVFAAESTSGTVLDLVPQDALFCVRLNNFDYTLGQFDQFLAGAIPVPIGVSMVARMQLSQLLGDPALSGVNTAGSFAVFGIAAKQDTASAEPIFGAMLMPVKDYSQFLELSANVGEPDSNGVSEIVMQPMGSGSGKTAISVKARDYALIGSSKNYTQILALAKSISDGTADSLTKSLDAEQTYLATEMPIWAYGDIDKINSTFGPMINAALVAAQAEMEKEMQKSGNMMGNAAEMMKVYFDAIKAFLQQGKYASLAIKPEPSVLRLKKTISAKADTEMAKLLSADSSLPKENMLIGYMEDGAAINCSAKINHTAMKKLTDFGMSFLKGMPGSSTEEDKAQWEQIVNDSMNAAGNMLVMSVKADPNNKPPFNFKYLVEIKDSQKYQQTQDKIWEMMDKGAMADMYKQMGLAIEADMQKAVANYKDVPIDSAKLQFKAVDPNSSEAQMIAAMYGEGFVYKIAYPDKYYALAMGGDADTGIRKLIDQVKAGPKTPVGEIKTAMDLLPEAKISDIFGTINVIRLMQLGLSFAPVPVPIPFDQLPTKSNIAFAAKASDGKLTVDISIPKEHIAEIAAIGMMMNGSQGSGPQPTQ